MRPTLDSAQLRSMLDMVQPTSEIARADEAFDYGVLRRLAEAFDCVWVSFQVSDPMQEQILELVEGVQGGPSFVVTAQDCPDEDRVFWAAHWEDPFCCYPETSGDHETVLLDSDFRSREAYLASVMSELCDRMEAVIVPLSPSGVINRRLTFWRVEGNGFQESDRLLLTLLRPHLERVLERHDRARTTQPQLTPRETELIGLLASGLTNRQIARQLGISQGTVRKHLEHVYARLGVTNRVAALAEVPELVKASRRRSTRPASAQ